MSSIHISAGAVVYRFNKENKVDVLVMHRESTNSWHLPKGTVEKDEKREDTAIREVREETGFSIKIEKYLAKLDSNFKRDGSIIQKETYYFLATLIDNSRVPHDNEHNKVCFLDYKEALRHLEDFSLYEKEGEILRMAEPCFAREED